MLGGQQFRAYKTIMKTSRYLPRRSESDVRLFRVIAWGAVIILAVITAASIAAKIASFELLSEPVFLAVIPIALSLLFCWWLTDVAPKLGRWLAVAVSAVACIGCLVALWNVSFWEQVQLAMLVVYSATVLRTAWRQLREGLDGTDGSETA